MLRRIFGFIYKTIAPIEYARSIGVKVGKNCRLIKVDYSSEPYLIKLGNHVSATKVRFETHDGGVWVFRDKYPDLDIVKPILVGNNVFIGYGTIILPGVSIGDDVVIGAHSVVTTDVPSQSVWAGVPAKSIKSIGEYEIKILPSTNKTKPMSALDKKNYYLDKYKNKI